MAWWGTAVGGALGLAFGGPLGALFGAALGRGLDSGVARLDAFRHVPYADKERLKERFLEGTFTVLGRLCKADGRVSEVEIAFARAVMERMGLGPDLRRAAILFFEQGKSPELDLTLYLRELRQAGLAQGPLLRIFLEIQLGAAYAEGPPTPAQREVLEQIRRGLSVPLGAFRRIERLIELQQRVLGAMGGGPRGAYGGAGAGPSPGWGPAAASGAKSLAGAYATLGVEPRASDAEVKRAYRRLMSQHHPDKLISRGAPESALKMATQKTQEIRQAYETVARARAT